MFRSVRKSRRLAKILFGLLALALAVGLVGTFTFWSLPNLPPKQEAGGASEEGYLSYLKAEEEELAQEVTALREKREKEPGNVDVLLSLGSALFRQGYFYLGVQRFPEAEESFKAAREVYEALLSLRPGDAEALLSLASLSYLLGDFEGARGLYKQALAAKPDYAPAHYNYALFLWEVDGNKEEAAAHLKQVLSLDQGLLAELARALLAELGGS